LRREDFFNRLGHRLFRREYWFLSELGRSLRAASNGWNRIHTIWGVDDDRQEYFSRRFAQIAKLRYV
jgi:hypothetical protein